MREIKFRAKVKGNWLDKVEGEWEYFSISDFVDSGLLGDNIDCPTLNHIDFETLGEYTGLKDRNGKEIYEGDIVKKDWYEPTVLAWGTQVVAVKWIENGYGAIFNTPEKLEVIGNIYENPELLETKNEN